MLTPRDGEARNRSRRGLVCVHAHRRGANAIEIASADAVRERTKRMLPVLPALHVAFLDLFEIRLERAACVMCRLGRTQAEAIGNRKVSSCAEIDLPNQRNVSVLCM